VPSPRPCLLANVPNVSRAPSIAPGTFFVAQSWADCITNMAGFNLRQAQAATARFRIDCPLCPAGITWVRLYRPRAEALNGTWKFPEAQRAN
jgi:hypothetical protein